jgi:hypothetical protein
MADNKLYIPTFISDDKFNPARVQPRVFYYNGLIDAPEYEFYHWTSANGSTSTFSTLDNIPYVDHYNVSSSGDLPNSGSNSLLFYNEVASYGTVPSNTLFSEYWDTYIELLYNPVTRLIAADAVIPLADYFELELNDIVEWRGNYYHLRAVNEYSFTDGTCKLQLLGPIIADTFSEPVDGNPCYSYDLYGDGESSTTFTYLDCDGEESQVIVGAQQVGFISCARPGSVIGDTQGSEVVVNTICGSYQ